MVQNDALWFKRLKYSLTHGNCDPFGFSQVIGTVQRAVKPYRSIYIFNHNPFSVQSHFHFLRNFFINLRPNWFDFDKIIGIREKALKPFDNVYKSCEMKFTSVPGGPAAGYNDKLFAQLAAGQAPDVFIIEIGLLPQMLKNDLLLDLKPFMDAENYDLSQFPKLAIDAYSHKGGIYGLPDNVASIPCKSEVSVKSALPLKSCLYCAFFATDPLPVASLSFLAFRFSKTSNLVSFNIPKS